ncbi:MAG TPA: glutamine-hydrolyzing GMP synthase [Chitinivibrionales bacterium]|nr:glutamine-hydrolyzing GMP synthase [Chitinivibrionales bacterium]
MDTIAVLDFGGQYTHLIANRIRRLNVYSEIVPSDIPANECRRFKGIILSGGPHSVLDKDRPGFNSSVLALGIPVLGLCYGHQLMAQSLGGNVVAGRYREYGIAQIDIKENSPLFAGLSGRQQIWMSHGDAVEKLPQGFEVIGSTTGCKAAAMGNETKRMYGLQFHPEVTDTPKGMTILENFISICKCSHDWNTGTFMREMGEEIKKKCGAKKVFLLVSGGVDSTVAFTLLNRVLGEKNVFGLHIDNGLMRQGESADILDYMKANGFGNLHVVDATEKFLSALKNIADPEEKRRIIGTTFIEVKEAALGEFGLDPKEYILGQGTIYPDTIESAGTRHAERIKTHHNRVDAVMELLEKGEIIEPLALLYKDEVRELGAALGLPEKLLWRHPFPGPGLGVRLLCSNGTESPVLQDTEKSVREISAKAGYESYVLPLKSVGVQGDSRTYAHPALVLGKQDWDGLETVSTSITNKIKGVNRVVYGLSVAGKPEYHLVKAYLTLDRLAVLRALDHLVTGALHKFGEYAAVWQVPVVLLPLVNKSGRQCGVLRPIMSQEAMTARFARLKDETLAYILEESKKIDGLGDLFYDVTHKPPATIEWE